MKLKLLPFASCSNNGLKPIVLSLIAFCLFLIALPLLAQDEVPVTVPQSLTSSPIHPTFALLDDEGVNVLESGGAVSTLKTCGTCHDTAFIVSTNGHGISDHWNGIDDGQRQDISSEMNCFLCHTAAPNNEARLDTLQSGTFEWTNTATLAGTGIVENTGGAWTWNPAAFDTDGNLLREYITIQDPSSEACGQCHGEVHTNAQLPVELTLPDASQWATYTTGQVFSPQKIASSGLNIAGKVDLSRTFDVHAERVLKCTNCHFASNNPVYSEDASSQPAHLTYDPRRLDFGDYLYRPLHQFNESGRDCVACHDALSTHTWLPYTERHTSAVACETCHIPTLYAPALQAVDWTVTPEIRTYRGTGDGLITGYAPVLLPREDADGLTRLAPYNLVTSWYWVAGENAEPVNPVDVEAAWMENGVYPLTVLEVFDSNNDGTLDDTERLIDNEAKQTLIASRLDGYDNPRIIAETKPYPINHTVATGQWATKDCRACHGNDSLVGQALTLSNRTPGGVQPTFVNLSDVHGTFQTDDSGHVFFQPETPQLYVFGKDSVSWVDWLGVLMFLGVFAAAFLHGGLRYLSARRTATAHHDTAPELQKVYMYSVYERQWHWLQTALIFGLIFTGMVIHKPAMFGMFSFAYMVEVHNILAAILVINAALAAFYHLASGEIQQFLPRPHGFFNDAIVQAKYYLYGIFKGEQHPFEKTRQRKMNPLQQVTYLAILNVLLPLQIITGALMWGAQHFPDLTAQLGGLGVLAPFHTLVAWAFASFIVMHVYLTTTGHTPMANIQSMIGGWEEVEGHPAAGD